MIKIRVEHRKRHKDVRGGTKSAGAAAARRGCQLQSAAGRQDSQGAATGGESWETCVSCLPRRQTTSLCFTGPFFPPFCSPPATPRLPLEIHRSTDRKKNEKKERKSQSYLHTCTPRLQTREGRGGGRSGNEGEEWRDEDGDRKVGQSTDK